MRIEPRTGDSVTIPAVPQSPNILVFLCDQLRRQALSCYGDPNVSTPNLDRLANRGVTFDNACSTYPVCVPFRFTLMTGQYAHTRCISAIGYRMSPAERTLADEFNDAGYDTYYLGKWHLDGGSDVIYTLGNGPLRNRPVRKPYRGNWKKWLGFELINSHFETFVFEDDAEEPTLLPGYQTEVLGELTRSTLRKRDPEKPFFCLLSVEPPHPPFEAPEEDLARWRDGELQLPPNFGLVDVQHDGYPDRNALAAYRKLASGHQLELNRIYYAMIENLDREVGRMLDFLEEEGLAANTVVMFLSDHGEMSGAHGCTGKSCPLEESVGIPLMVVDPRYPERGGTRVSAPTCTEDLFPTLCGLAGITPRDEMPGEDLSSLLAQGGELARPGVMLQHLHDARREGAYFEHNWRVFRSARYMYEVFGRCTEPLVPWRFYDLENDPHQLHNLLDSPSHQELVKEHHGWLRARMAETGDDLNRLAAAFGWPALFEVPEALR